jgi:hypothetical protein
MTPQEQAQALVDKYTGLENPLTSHELEGSYIDENVAKQCALITVGEIYLVESGYFGDYGNAPYWLQVKTEIEKL